MSYVASLLSGRRSTNRLRRYSLLSVGSVHYTIRAARSRIGIVPALWPILPRMIGCDGDPISPDEFDASEFRAWSSASHEDDLVKLFMSGDLVDLGTVDAVMVPCGHAISYDTDLLRRLSSQSEPGDSLVESLLRGVEHLGWVGIKEENGYSFFAAFDLDNSSAYAFHELVIESTETREMRIVENDIVDDRGMNLSGN